MHIRLAAPCLQKYESRSESQTPQSSSVDSTVAVSFSTSVWRVAGVQRGHSDEMSSPLAKEVHSRPMRSASASSGGVKPVKEGSSWKTKGSSLAWQTTCAQIGGSPKVGKIDALL